MIREYPKVWAVFVNNPIYYGIYSSLKAITGLTCQHGMLILVDRTHGIHLYFGEDLPLCITKAKADMTSVSIYKFGGSLT